MKILILLTSFLISTSLYANDKEIKNLMNNYLKSLHHFDANLLMKVSSDQFYKQMEKTVKGKKLKHKGDFENYDFDISIKQANVTPNRFFVKLKSKGDKGFGDYFYVVDKKNKAYLIDSMGHSEE